jgi:DNA processing protein
VSPPSDTERRAWLRLARTQNVGPVTFAQLIARFGSAGSALKDVPRLAKRGGGDALRIPSEDDAAREIAALSKLGGCILISGEADYPASLRAAEPAPPVISVLGHTTLLQREAVAIVGARNASALGRKLAHQLARDLGKAGLVVASGLARGIDGAAHEGALDSGTVAVVAGGVDNIYPPEHRPLYERIVAEGCVVSEMPLGTTPNARHFPRRNRIISGLSRGTLVVEAAEGSGSLITARYALEQNREIFAVPGSPLDPRARGTNRLLREGAVLTESAEDVLAVLRPMLGQDFRDPGRGGPIPPDFSDEQEADRLRARVEEALGPAPVAVDELVRICGAPAGVVLTILLELELAGRLTRHPGNQVSWS